MIKALVRFLVIGLTLSFLFTPKANALTAGEAVLTVAGGALAGTILGASTLPFYETPGDHTKNIFGGAAVGAVIGVVVAAAAGFAQTNESLEEESASLQSPSLNLLAPVKSIALTKPNNDVLLWQSNFTVARF